jgi:hypothetical protein
MSDYTSFGGPKRKPKFNTDSEIIAREEKKKGTGKVNDPSFR